VSRAKAKARAKGASKPPQAAVRVSELTTFLDQQNRAWQKIEALMVALEFAANHEAEFDVSDGLAGVITLIGQSLTALDTLEVRHGN
jgi:hypothetical protein